MSSEKQPVDQTGEQAGEQPFEQTDVSREGETVAGLEQVESTAEPEEGERPEECEQPEEVERPEEGEHASVPEDGPKERSWLMEWGPTIAIPIVVALFVHAFILEAFIVPTGSMLNTIQLNDRVWSEKVSYRFRNPEVGEVVLFSSPVEKDVTLLKRVIATEGQTVDLVDGKVVVDGQVLDEPYTEDRPSYPLDRHAPGIEPVSYPLVVPEGHLWLMGDNRTNSLDSRYYGPIPTSSVVARAFCTYWPLDHVRSL